MTAMVDQNNKNFKHGAILPCGLVKKLWNLILRCGDLYSEQMIGNYFVEKVNSSILDAVYQSLLKYVSDKLERLTRQPQMWSY